MKSTPEASNEGRTIYISLSDWSTILRLDTPVVVMNAGVEGYIYRATAGVRRRRQCMESGYEIQY
jgi:hypothetical protein